MKKTLEGIDFFCCSLNCITINDSNEALLALVILCYSKELGKVKGKVKGRVSNNANYWKKVTL